LLHVGMITFSLLCMLCRAFGPMLIRSVVYQEESEDVVAPVKEEMSNEVKVEGNETSLDK